ncbi:MAG: SMC family ATPase [Candidatus Hadarchaeales archaeon]
MITKVRLKNWKSHEETTIVLGDGTNVLVGIMGAGKSSVLDAITYALFGTLPAVKTRRLRLEDLITSRPVPKQRADVEVQISTEKGEYLVRRAIERGRGTVLAELRKATGELIEGGSSDRVTENVEKILGITADIYERAVYAEQNQLDYFLTIPKGKRMESIDELLGIKKLEEGRKNIGTLANKIGQRADELRAQIQQMKGDPSLAKLPALEEEISKLEDDLSRKNLELQSVERELQKVSESYEAMAKVAKEISELKTKLASQEATVQVLKKNREELVAMLKSYAEIPLQDLLNKSRELQERYLQKAAAAEEMFSKFTSASLALRTLEDEKRVVEEKIETLSAEIQEKLLKKNELDSLPEKLEETVAELRSVYINSEKAIAEMNARLDTLSKSLEELSAVEAVCPVCESQLSAEKKDELIEKRRKEIADVKERITNLLKERDSKKATLDKYESILQKAKILENEIKNLQEKEGELSALKTRLEEIQKKLGEARENITKIEAMVTHAKNEKEAANKEMIEFNQIVEKRMMLEKTKNDLATASSLEESTRRRLEEVSKNYSEEEFKKIEDERNSLTGRENWLKAEIQGIQKNLDTKRELLKSIQQKLYQIKYSEAKFANLQKAEEALNAFQRALADAQIILRRRFLGTVNEVMKDLWEAIYPYGDFVGIRLAVEEPQSDYALQLKDRSGEWRNVEGGVSGGERTEACLAFRIALAMALAPNLSWLVLDEPTHNLDEKAVEELAKVMRERLPGIVKQIILITHDEKFEAAVSGHLYRFNRDKASDGPTIVEHITASGMFGGGLSQKF